MKVHVKIEHEKMKVDETFTGNTAEEVVAAMKARVLRDLPFALRLAASTLNTTAFAREVVNRYNDSTKQTLPLPNTCEEFLELAQKQGFAVVEL